MKLSMSEFSFIYWFIQVNGSGLGGGGMDVVFGDVMRSVRLADVIISIQQQ